MIVGATVALGGRADSVAAHGEGRQGIGRAGAFAFDGPGAIPSASFLRNTVAAEFG
jgi:hypothetical protein